VTRTRTILTVRRPALLIPHRESRAFFFQPFLSPCEQERCGPSIGDILAAGHESDTSDPSTTRGNLHASSSEHGQHKLRLVCLQAFVRVPIPASLISVLLFADHLQARVSTKEDAETGRKSENVLPPLKVNPKYVVRPTRHTARVAGC
jgi:hypothetical protein